MGQISAIEGIGERAAAGLAKAGVRSTAALLTRAGGAAGRRELAKATGVTEKRLLDWVNRADLMRIKGVGEEYSDLLERAGVDSVLELGRRKAANLAATMTDVNKKKKLVRKLPTEAQVADWIAQAKGLPKVVKH